MPLKSFVFLKGKKKLNPCWGFRVIHLLRVVQRQRVVAFRMQAWAGLFKRCSSLQPSKRCP
jgi:hypothetical protein